MQNCSTYIALILSTAIGLACMPAYAAEEQKDPYEDNLLGNWGGIRTKMSDAGIDPTLEYKADMWSITSGGADPSEHYLDNLDIKFALDNEKLLGIKGNRALIYFINNNGNHPNASHLRSAEGIDNIEVGTNTFKLYEAWVEQDFWNGRASALVGLHDLNSEFLVTDLSANFIKPVMQVPQTIAQSGQNGPSIFPTTSLAGRIKVLPTEETYISVAAFDGVPGDPNNPHGTHVDLRTRDGLLLITEIGCTPKAPEGVEGEVNKFAIGGWTYTKKADDMVDVDGNGNPIKRRMQGAYLLSSYQFYHDKNSGHDLGAFFRAGIADGNTAQVNWDYTAGIVGNGWMPTRPDSEIGLAFSQAHNDSKYIQSVSGVADHNEYGFELYYRDTITNGLSVQPDLQYIVNPGTDKVTKNATVVGIRFDINF